MFAACKAWIEGNLQPSAASRSERFLQTGGREKTPSGEKVRLDTGKNRNTAKIAKEQANKLQTNYSQTYSHIQRKIRSDLTQDLAEEFIVQFFHSEIVSRIDTNQWG